MKTTDSPDAVATVRGDEGASVLGPDNVAIALQNPGAAATDSGSLPNLKFPFAAAHNRLQTGGWAREVTVRELPVATTLAGVNMRLNAGAYRELHWHKEAEWAFMLSGSARIAAIDPQGRNFIDDIGRGARYPDALFPVWRYHPFVTNSTLPTAEADITHRRHAMSRPPSPI